VEVRVKLLNHDYWKVVECIQGDSRCLEVVEADDSDLVVCRIPVITEQTKKEAKIIAAAPELLRASKFLYHYLDANIDQPARLIPAEIVEAVRRAISKAEG
jgi:hypothetical protein